MDFPDRDHLIAALAAYRRLKRHEITIVFDGTHRGTGSGDESFSSGIEVIFSPITVTADDIIEKMLPRLEPSSTIIVSSDHRVQNAARRYGATFVSSEDFAKRLFGASRTFSEEEDSGPKPKKGNPRKLSKENRKRRKKLERL